MATRVPTTEYRAKLRQWHERAQRGERIVVTDKGQPTVLVTSADAEALLDRLERDGLLRGGRRRRPASEIDSVAAPGDSTAAVSAKRDR